VIEKEEEKTASAAEQGVSALRGNAESEKMLTIADVSNAKLLFACTDQDHTNLMICLTARSISEKIQIIAIAKENVKLFKQSGTTKVISLSEIVGTKMVDETDINYNEVQQEVS
jgi:Trk K+ transport system NAD-binding subunit